MESYDSKHWWYCARRDILRDYLARMADLPKDAHILEIGCGTGHNLVMLSEFGHVDAIEIDEIARGIASQRLGRPVGSAPLPELDGIQEGAYDLIAVLDVIEHIDRDVDALKSMARRLKPGGKILITVPAHQWMWSTHDVVNHHCRRYSKTTLARSLSQAGLKHNGLRWFNSILFPLAVAARLASRVTGKDDSDDALPSPIVNGTFKTIFGAEKHLLGRVPLPIGLSIITLASVPGAGPA